MKELRLENIEDAIERQVVGIIREYENCSVGNVIKDLSLSYSRGLKVIQSLKQKGWVTSHTNPPFLNLNVQLI
ncbi:MAG: hypothetical protein GVY19_06575 [Bacteroidetes bacterium]|jgi:DNA-binding MarR family transcriptional regulator|nr:hypothetical protein [Bacteroidota bacterium]